MTPARLHPQATPARSATLAEVIDAGSRTTIQDLGRPGHAHLGVPPSGAADRASLTLANRLVGNAEGAPALETTLRGPTLQFLRAATIALTGARVDATLDARPVAMDAPLAVRPGQVLVVGTATLGLRTYVAVRGGLAAPRTLGSASTDELTGLGPAPLATGDGLSADRLELAAPAVDVAPVSAIAPSPTLRVTVGPRDDWFAPDAVTALLTEPFAVTASVNRIGVRLRGPVLPHREQAELRSEGVVTGSIQVPPSGGPIVLLADHPTTGGYPVIAVVVGDDLSLAAQLRPGDHVRFKQLAGPAAAPRTDRLP
ncbi:MAG: biotin-dependent carboxyltransferase family protein [Solirubrobacteraceae bacterium]|nr:biotin-dependent carboxyltransferase family protein [Solirubrobacteraceae bacterium]